MDKRWDKKKQGKRAYVKTGHGKDIQGKKADAASKFLKYGIAGFIVIIAAAIVFIYLSVYSKSYVASMGNDKITVSEYKFFLKQTKDLLLRIADSAGTTDPDTFWNTKIKGEATIDIAKQKALDSAADFKIQVIKARDLKVVLGKSDLDTVDSYVQEIISQNKNSTTQADAFCKTNYGVSLNDFKEILKQGIITNKLISHETAGMNVTDKDVEDYYSKNSDKYIKDTQMRTNGEEAVWARHILISTKDSQGKELAGAQLDDARKKAQDLLDKVKNGGDFTQLAKDNSQDSGSAQYGGDYVFGRNIMPAEFEKAAFDELNPGQVYDQLVKTVDGYNIIKLEEKIPKDQPVSLRCAKEYREFGAIFIKSQKFVEKIDTWKKEPKYTLRKNDIVYNSIK